MNYPVMLALQNKTVVFVGGGWETEAKVRGLLAAGARVRLVSAGDHLGLEGAAGLEWERRPFQDGDLAGAWLAFAHTGDAADNARVFTEAERRGIFCNAVDDAPHSSFTMPAVLRRGDLVVAVSTSGRAPVLAVRIRDRIAAEFGPEYGDLLELLGRLREEVRGRHADFEARRALWHRLADSEALALLRAGRREEAERLLRGMIEEP